MLEPVLTGELTMPGPIHGITVVDMSRVLAGPWAGQLLADYGAEVDRLRGSFQLGTVSRDDRLCPYGGDALVVGSAGRDTARIAAIRLIRPEEADWLLVRFGKKDPAEEQTPAPEPLESAEVEELD